MKNKKINIVTGLCHKYDDCSKYPQLMQNKSNQRLFTYLKCTAVFFASSIRNNPNSRHILFTNLEKLPKIGKFDIEKLFFDLGVEIKFLPFTYRPPKKFSKNFTAAYYKLDIFRYLAKNTKEEEISMFFDSDCVWINSADKIIKEITKNRFQLYDCESSPPPNKKNLGTSRKDLLEIYKFIDINFPNKLPIYIGGEFLSGTKKIFMELFLEFDKVFKKCIRNYNKIPKFSKDSGLFDGDEYIMNFVYNKLNYVKNKRADKFIKRIWTLPFFNNTSENDFDLSVWHVLAEKEKGLSRLFKQVCKPNSLFWELPLGNQFAKYIGNYLGIPKTNFKKIFFDFFAYKVIGLKNRFGLID